MGLAAIRQYSLPEFTRASTFLLDILSFSRFLHLSSVEMPLEVFAMGNELNAEIIISSLGDYGFFSGQDVFFVSSFQKCDYIKESHLETGYTTNVKHKEAFL